METGQGSKFRFSRFISRVKDQMYATGNALDQFFIPAAYYGPFEVKNGNLSFYRGINLDKKIKDVYSVI